MTQAALLPFPTRMDGMDDTGIGNLFEGVSDAIIVLDGDGRVCLCNPEAARLFGVSAGEAITLPIESVVPGLTLADGGAIGRRQLPIRREGIDSQRIDVSLSPIDVAGSSWQFLLIARPVVHESEADPRDPAGLYDELTRLPARALFTDRVEHVVNGLARRRSPALVLLLDIDRFREINATLGHEGGDEVLRAVAERLRGGLRASDTLARFGEDQFGVLVRARTTPAAVVQLADRLQSRLLRPFQIGGVTLYVTVTIGVALGRERVTAEELVRQADTALHHAKQLGPGRVEVFNAEMSAGTVDRRQVESDLRLALERNELEVFYQPQIRLADGTLDGFEALVRWRQPGRGLRPPSDFLDVAATTGLIVPMGRFVLREACRQVSRWQPRRRSGPPLTVSVNLSASEILQPDLIDEVRGALAELGLPADALELEITETAVLEASEETLGVLRQLKEIGVRLAIDDFGVGYNYLSHLRDFPIDRIKIDRSFIAGLDTAGDNRTIVEAVVRLAQELGLGVVAEGVETMAQAGLLLAMGCDLAQGYHYAPPLSARAAALFKRTTTFADTRGHLGTNHTGASPVAVPAGRLAVGSVGNFPRSSARS